VSLAPLLSIMEAAWVYCACQLAVNVGRNEPMAFWLGLVDWCICILVLIATLFLGLFLAIRRNASANSSRFFLADRRFILASGRRLFYLQPILGRSSLSAFRATLIAADCRREPSSSTCWTVGFAAFFLFPFYICNRVLTTPEFLETRFHPIARVFFPA
jgi:hypothetical protein